MSSKLGALEDGVGVVDLEDVVHVESWVVLAGGVLGDCLNEIELPSDILTSLMTLFEMTLNPASMSSSERSMFLDIQAELLLTPLHITQTLQALDLLRDMQKHRVGGPLVGKLSFKILLKGKNGILLNKVLVPERRYHTFFSNFFYVNQEVITL